MNSHGFVQAAALRLNNGINNIKQLLPPFPKYDFSILCLLIKKIHLRINNVITSQNKCNNITIIALVYIYGSYKWIKQTLS